MRDVVFFCDEVMIPVRHISCMYIEDSLLKVLLVSGRVFCFYDNNSLEDVLTEVSGMMSGMISDSMDEVIEFDRDKVHYYDLKKVG